MTKRVHSKRVSQEKGIHVAKETMRPIEQTMSPVDDLTDMVKQLKPDDAVQFLEIIKKDPDLLSQYGGVRGLEHLLGNLEREGYFEIYGEKAAKVRRHLKSVIREMTPRKAGWAKKVAEAASETEAVLRETASPVLSKSLQDKVNLESVIYAARLEQIDPKKRGLVNYTIGGLPDSQLTALKKLLADLTGHREVLRATKSVDHVKDIRRLAAELADKWQKGEVTLTDNLLRVPIATATRMSGNPVAKRLKTIQLMIQSGKPIAFAEEAASVDEAFRNSLNRAYETLQKEIKSGKIEISPKTERVIERATGKAKPSVAEEVVRTAAMPQSGTTVVKEPVLPPTYIVRRIESRPVEAAEILRRASRGIPVERVSAVPTQSAYMSNLLAEAAALPRSAAAPTVVPTGTGTLATVSSGPPLTNVAESVLRKAATPITRLNPPMLTYTPERLPVVANVGRIPARLPSQGVGMYLGPDPLAALREQLAARSMPIPVEAQVESIRIPYQFEMGPPRLTYTPVPVASAEPVAQDVRFLPTGRPVPPEAPLVRARPLARRVIPLSEVSATAAGETSEAALRAAATGSRAASAAGKVTPELERLANEIVAAAGAEAGEVGAKTTRKSAGQLARSTLKAAGKGAVKAGKGAVRLAARHPILAALLALGLAAAGYGVMSGGKEEEAEGGVALIPESGLRPLPQSGATAEDVMRILAATPRYKVPVFVSPYEYRME